MTALFAIIILLILVISLETGYIFHDRMLQDKERTEARKQIKDLTDKIYFIQSKQDYIANKVIDTPVTQKPATEEVHVPLDQVDPDTLAEAFKHGSFE